MNDEIWKDIPGYEGIYQMSNLKRVKSLERLSYNNKLIREKILKNNKHGNYYSIWLTKDNKPKLYYIDKLYYQIFKMGE